jgi:hypothetical protein
MFSAIRMRSGIDILQSSFRFRVKPMVFIKMLVVTFMLPFGEFGVWGFSLSY